MGVERKAFLCAGEAITLKSGTYIVEPRMLLIRLAMGKKLTSHVTQTKADRGEITARLTESVNSLRAPWRTRSIIFRHKARHDYMMVDIITFSSLVLFDKTSQLIGISRSHQLP